MDDRSRNSSPRPAATIETARMSSDFKTLQNNDHLRKSFIKEDDGLVTIMINLEDTVLKKSMDNRSIPNDSKIKKNLSANPKSRLNSGKIS